MKGVKTCCWLIPMDPGCLAIGGFYILLNLSRLIQAITILAHIKENKMDDQENIDQKKTVTLYYWSQFPFYLIQLVVGIWVLVATVKRLRLQLKICAIVVIVTVLLPLSIVAAVGFYSRPVEYVDFALELAVALYSTLVLFSFNLPPPEYDASEMTTVSAAAVEAPDRNTAQA